MTLAVATTEAAARLAEGLAALKAPLPAGARERLADYLALLAKWNRTYNLTAIREPERMVTHHLLDSLAVLPWLDARLAQVATPSLLDVGSGAGLPGLPIAIARPEVAVTLLEPVRKKGAFITQAIAELGVRNARVAFDRVEDFEPGTEFDIVISRAFAELAGFHRSAWRHVARGGALVAMKAQRPEVEVAGLPPGTPQPLIHRLGVPGLAAERHLVTIERKEER